MFGFATVGTVVYWGTFAYMNRTKYIRFDWCAYTAVALFNSLNQVIIPKAEISHMNETENKHVADGLAWSYYFGYLKLMLPALDQMVSEAVQDNGYAVENCDLRDKLAASKVFIVIPKNCYTYASFNDADKRIDFACSMPPQKKARGGVQERIYKNTVWKIKVTENEEPLYVLMEYATPCLSMYDMQKSRKAHFTEDDLEAQVKEFSIKLQSILDDDPDCTDKFQIVLCGDIKDQRLADVINDAIRNERNIHVDY